MNPPALRLQAVTKRYGLQPALDRVDLAVERGEFFGLVGLNGAGKTTLIKGLLDFCDLDGGIAEIFGISHLRTESRRGLAFLPERFTPPYFLTGRDFLRYMLRLHGVPFSPPRVAQVLAELDLEPAALQKPVRDFSKGMSQKLGLAACLLSDRDLLVLDEPMSGASSAPPTSAASGSRPTTWSRRS